MLYFRPHNFVKLVCGNAPHCTFRCEETMQNTTQQGAKPEPLLPAEKGDGICKSPIKEDGGGHVETHHGVPEQGCFDPDDESISYVGRR